MYSYFSIGNGQSREPALYQLYRRTFVPYTFTSALMNLYYHDNASIVYIAVNDGQLTEVF